MSYLKVTEELFLEKQELNRLIQFLDTDGWRLVFQKDLHSSGIIKAGDDLSFDSFKVEQGTNQKTVKIATASYAVDASGRIIFKNVEDNIAIPDDGKWYWMKIKHIQSPTEEGVVDIDSRGNLTGSGTKFLDVLRGQPNFPARVKLYGTSSNPLDYDVVEVIDDENAVLSGEFQAETELRYSVVGTFSPSHVPASEDKEIYQYDSCNDFTVDDSGLIEEITTNTAPNKTEGEEYYIARVKVDGLSVLIEDKRLEIFQTKAENALTVIEDIEDKFVGVESVQYTHETTPRTKNKVTVGWGLRSSNWTISSSNREIVINNGQGGRIKDSVITNNFENGDFDGWRVYSEKGTYRRILSSSIDGSSIKIVLDVLDPDDYTSNTYIRVVPEADNILIKAYGAEGPIPLLDTEKLFSIEQAVGDIYLEVPTTTYSYNLKYRIFKNGVLSSWYVFPSDDASGDDFAGFYDESSYDSKGVLKIVEERNKKKYTADDSDGFIELTKSATHYDTVVGTLARGDLIGVSRVTLSEEKPLYTLTVGSQKTIQIFDSDETLDGDWFIHLNDTDAKEANYFDLYFESDIDLSTFNLRIVENYVSTVSYDELFSFLKQDVDLLSVRERFHLHCVYDGSNWTVFRVHENLAASGSDVQYGKGKDGNLDIDGWDTLTV